MQSPLDPALVLHQGKPPRDFLHVGRLVPPTQEIVSVGPEESTGTALDLMRKHDFSQMPVMTAGRVLGTFTWRSFANGFPTVAATCDDALSVPYSTGLKTWRSSGPGMT
jgi:CBS-domain-containing membrane protein